MSITMISFWYKDSISLKINHDAVGELEWRFGGEKLGSCHGQLGMCPGAAWKVPITGHLCGKNAKTPVFMPQITPSD
eukprot:843051-Pelagomonas_calceolata.AAC.5